MEERFLTFVAEQSLLTGQQRVLLAVSGGIDSVVMVRLFALLPHEVAIAHCNFQLRGPESDGDEDFVRSLARAGSIPFYSQQFDTAGKAQEEGISIQMAARLLRMRWMETVADKEGYDLIATAHHRNDSIETALFNFAKGTGISGVRGIVSRQERLIRPMLFASRHDIAAYAARHGLQWREDRSNKTRHYARNLIRHDVVPALRKINPNLENTFSTTFERLAATEAVLLASVENARASCVDIAGAHTYIHMERLSQLPSPALLLSELIKPFGFGYVQAREMCQCWQQREPGRLFSSATHTANIDRSSIIVSPDRAVASQHGTIEATDAEFEYSGRRFLLERIEAKTGSVVPDHMQAYLDADTVKFPFKIRPWQAGDWFIPLGMRGKKKVSDFMIDSKIPVNLKSRVLVLCSGEAIAWVVGHRIDNRFKVTDNTRSILKVTVDEND
jgi:tRNA(Ile)-lysidine synthase